MKDELDHMNIVRKYAMPLWLLLLGIVFFGIPALIVSLNSPPEESELVHFHAKVLSVRDRQPNLSVLLPGGEQSDFLFPAPLYTFFRGGARFPGLSDVQEMRLTGCDAEIYGADFKYVWPRAFRVWKIDCSAQPVSYEQVVTEFNKMTRAAAWPQAFGVFVTLFFVALTFIKARKRK